MKRKLKLRNTGGTAKTKDALFASNADFTVKQYEQGKLDKADLARVCLNMFPERGRSYAEHDLSVWFMSSPLEISIKRNNPLHMPFTEFRGTVRKKDGTIHDVLTYSDEFDEGLMLTYLKMCAVAGDRL